MAPINVGFDSMQQLNLNVYPSVLRTTAVTIAGDFGVRFLVG